MTVKTFDNGRNFDFEVEVAINEKMYPEVVEAFRKVKYSSVDFALQPDQEALAEEVERILLGEIEEKITDGEKDFEYISIGYANSDRGGSDYLIVKMNVNEVKQDERFEVEVLSYEQFSEKW